MVNCVQIVNSHVDGVPRSPKSRERIIKKMSILIHFCHTSGTTRTRSQEAEAAPRGSGLAAAAARAHTQAASSEAVSSVALHHAGSALQLPGIARVILLKNSQVDCDCKIMQKDCIASYLAL